MLERLFSVADRWRVAVREIRDSGTSVLGFGTRGAEAVVLKIVRPGVDEWEAGSVVAAFHGRGMVRVLEHEPGALLLEHLQPGTSLVELVMAGRDRAATEVMADVVHAMHAVPASCGGATPLRELAAAFDRYLAGASTQIERELVLDARNRYRHLCETQQEERLLHGDLQHSNVLFDARRGWVAVDPKGLQGELEYDVGATFRNPREAADLYPRAATIESRLKIFEATLHLDAARALEWLYAQAVLSAVWVVEDGGLLGAEAGTIRLATAARGMLG